MTATFRRDDDATFEAALRGWETREPVDAAEDARVEAAARWLFAYGGNRPNHWVDVLNEQSRNVVREEARDLLAALTADAATAPQVDTAGTVERHEWQCPSCGATTRARMADHAPASTADLVSALESLLAYSRAGTFDEAEGEREAVAQARAAIARAALGESR